MKFGFATTVVAWTAFSIVRGLPLDDVLGSCKIAASWFAGWHEDQFTPKDVSWSKYTHVLYAFAMPSEDPSKLDESGLTGLPNFVQTAHSNGVKALLSVGGWTGSRFFSTAFASASNRTAFIKAVTDLASKHQVDGLEFDWEYPSKAGIGCNTMNPNDTSNFLVFLQELRSHPVGKSLILTAAVPITPWAGEDGNPVTDVSGFAKVLDYVSIMNYDIWGPWSATVGPNAPLDDTCAPAADRGGSATSAVNAWTKAGMPAELIVLGIPAYGHSFRVRKDAAFEGNSTDKLALYPAFDSKDRPAGDKWDDQAGGVDVCGVKSQYPGGSIRFWGMIQLGYLDEDGKPNKGRPYRFDECTKTPYIYNPEKEIMVSFDNPKSMKAKGKFIHKNKLGGFAMWETGGDYKDYLLDAVRKGAHF